MMRSIVCGLLLCGSAALAQKVPDAGQLLMQSPDYRGNERMRHGCVLSTICLKDTKQLCCAPVIIVSISPGTTTVWADDRVTTTTRVRCGCDQVGGPDGPSCNVGGVWLARKRVTSTGTGQFTITHGHALGDEQVVCVLE